MSKTMLVLFAACVGLSLLSLHLVKQMHAGQATIAELQAQVADLERQRQQQPAPQAPDPGPTMQPEQVASAPTVANKEAPKVAAVKPAEPEIPMMGSVPSREERLRMMRESRERQRQLMQDPEYREAMRIQQRSNISRQYPGIGPELGLTTEQTEQLFDLLADQQVRSNEQAQQMWDGEGLDPAGLQQRQEKMQQQWAEIQRRNEAELAAQLGPDKLQAWKEYQSTLGARHQAEQLRATLAGRGVPLNEDASRAIVKAYADAQKIEMQEYANVARANAASSSKPAAAMFGSRTPSPEMYERQLEITRRRNQRVLDALSPYLTYEQREALQKEHEAELKMQEAHMRMMRAQSNLDGGNDRGWSSPVQGGLVPIQ